MVVWIVQHLKEIAERDNKNILTGGYGPVVATVPGSRSVPGTITRRNENSAVVVLYCKYQEGSDRSRYRFLIDDARRAAADGLVYYSIHGIGRSRARQKEQTAQYQEVLLSTVRTLLPGITR